MNDSAVSIPGRDARHQRLVPADRLSRCHANLIGVGAIGRHRWRCDSPP